MFLRASCPSVNLPSSLQLFMHIRRRSVKFARPQTVCVFESLMENDMLRSAWPSSSNPFISSLFFLGQITFTRTISLRTPRRVFPSILNTNQIKVDRFEEIHLQAF